MEKWRESFRPMTGKPAPRSAIREYGRWRRRATRQVFDALEFYSRYCVGQFAGMGEALNMEAIRFGCEAEGIPASRWPEVVEEATLIHRVVTSRAKESKPHGR